MNLNDYASIALSTCTFKDRQFDLEHAAIGMMTEAGELLDCYKKLMVYGKELDLINLREEVGDCMWYALLGAKTLGFDFTLRPKLDVFCKGEDITMFDVGLALLGTACGFGACVTDPDDEQSQVLDMPKFFANFIALLYLIGERHGFTLEEAADANIAKLSKRYPEGTFSSTRALNRDLASERTVLELNAERFEQEHLDDDVAMIAAGAA